MGEFAIECTSCSTSFATEAEYNNHECLEDDGAFAALIKSENESDPEEITGVDLKQEPIELDDEIDPLNFLEGDINMEEEEEEAPIISDDTVMEIADIENDIDQMVTYASKKGGRTLVDEQQSTEQFLAKWSSLRTLKLESTGENVMEWCCKLCSKSFLENTLFTKHFFAEHNKVKPYSCGICQKKFLHKHYVAHHMRLHTGEKPYACNLCPKSYRHKTSYTIHMRIHNGVRPFECNVCHKKCYDKSGLTSHMRSHTKETPYHCQVCGRRFTHSKSLLVHRRNHTGEKPYVCSYCGKAFRHWHKHKIHVRLHTGERPYKCKICNKGFPRNDEVHRHMKSHQGIKSFKCSICGTYCATQASITGHIDLHHSDQKPNVEFPEKTLVENNRTGILGRTMIDPAAVLLSKYNDDDNDALEMIDDPGTSTASTSMNHELYYEKVTKKHTYKPKTRVIEVVSNDPPIQKKKPKPLLPRSETNSSTQITPDLSNFNAWQEKMQQKQGLIVKKFDKDGKVLENDTKSPTEIQSPNAQETNPAINTPLLLVTQSNGQKLLLPMNLLSSALQTQLAGIKTEPTETKSDEETPQNKKDTNHVLLPNPASTNASNTPVPSALSAPTMFLVQSPTGSKLIIMPPNSQNNTDLQIPAIKIKEEPPDLCAGIVIKTEKKDDYEKEKSVSFSPIKIKEEPQD